MAKSKQNKLAQDIARSFGSDEARGLQAKTVQQLMTAARTMLDLWYLEYDEALIPAMVKSVEELGGALTTAEQWGRRKK